MRNGKTVQVLFGQVLSLISLNSLIFSNKRCVIFKNYIIYDYLNSFPICVHSIEIHKWCLYMCSFSIYLWAFYHNGRETTYSDSSNKLLYWVFMKWLPYRNSVLLIGNSEGFKPITPLQHSWFLFLWILLKSFQINFYF